MNNTVNKTVQILKVIAASREGKTLSQLVRELEYPKSTVFNILRSLEELGLLLDSVYDIKEWEQICLKTGYKFTDVKQIYGELPAPSGDKFPFENEIMQWMGEYLCISCK